jgi:glutamyl-tRNA synthetase
MTQTDHSLAETLQANKTRVPRLRYAPSPTGFQHIGGFRTALFSWLYTRHCGGQFILRIEDTDIARTVEGTVDDILHGFSWLEMNIDEGPGIGGPYGPYYQLQRKALYQHYTSQLIASGHAYRCYCTPEQLDEMRKEQEAQKLPPRYDRRCRYLTNEERTANDAAGLPWTVRYTMPLDGETVVHDQLHGDMVFQNADLNDFIILKANGLAPYHLAHLVDDHLMGITHVLRGEEWIPSAPRHIQLYQALGWEPPLFYHLPSVLGKDKKKLSKRRNAPSWNDYRREGYLPEAVFNFLALLGWSFDDKTELFTREELIRVFTLDRIGVSAGIYDPDKLLWMNGVYIRQLSLEELVRRTLPYLERPATEGGLPDAVQRPLDRTYTTRVLHLEHERLKTLGEAAHVVSFFYEQEISYDPALLIQKGMDAPRTKTLLEQARDALQQQTIWESTELETLLRGMVTPLGVKAGQFFGTIRTAVSGRTATPPLFQMMEVLGRTVSMQRIQQAIDLL